jgi:hypothetical protein
MIPISTTTITVYSPATPDLDAEPYSGTEDTAMVASASGIPAVIDRPRGREQIAGGEQAVWDFELICDNTPISRFSQIGDDTTGVRYDVVWVWELANDHVEAGLRLVQGDI